MSIKLKLWLIFLISIVGFFVWWGVWWMMTLYILTALGAHVWLAKIETDPNHLSHG